VRELERPSTKERWVRCDSCGISTVYPLIIVAVVVPELRCYGWLCTDDGEFVVCPDCVGRGREPEEARFPDVLDQAGWWSVRGFARESTITYWRIWCRRDPEWCARGVCFGRDANQAAFDSMHDAQVRLRNELGVEPPGVWFIWADVYGASDEHLLAAMGLGELREAS
jgi:hypothetical protein